MLKKIDKFLFEELAGHIYKDSNSYELYMNPKSIKRMGMYLRAVSTPNGDFFIADDDGMYIIHLEIYNWIYKNKNYNLEAPIYSTKWLNKVFLKGFIPWQRALDSNEFFIGESVSIDLIEENKKMIESYIKKIKKKNSKLVFYPERFPNI